jgi:hypothetical protein
MMKPHTYGQLCKAIEASSAQSVTSEAQYAMCHHLPNWYALCEEFTPKTIVVEVGADYLQAVAHVNWSAYFVKDFVKSLTTNRGSIARNAREIADVVAQIEKYRGAIEGGICIREFENFEPSSEERFFVFQGVPFARNGAVPSIVHAICERIESPFFTVDIAMSTKGVARLIELGDGQVSDRKSWTAEQFVGIFADA